MAQGLSNHRGIAFIVGCPRSGTTWTWGLLNAHPDTVMLTPADVGKHYTTPETGLFMNYADPVILAAVEKKRADHPGKAIVEKTPLHCLKIGKIFALFADARVVFVRRDAKATINSMLHNGEASGTPSTWDLRASVLIYGLAYRAWLAWRDDSRVATVHYEDLSAMPQITVARLFGWLGLEGHVDECVEANHRTPAFGAPGVLRNGTVDSWKEELSGGQVEYLDNVFGKAQEVA